MKISVCTLAHGREEHLANLVRGLGRSLEAPSELIVAVMQTDPYDLPEVTFPVRQLMLDGDRICLAEARNAAAAEARGDLLVFLDVDCIPSPGLLRDYAQASCTHDGILMGEVGYLPAGATDRGIDYARFERVAVKHSERAGPPDEAVGPCSDYRCFWSLNFAIKARVFDALGGFDPRYVGYGGEDTDFGRSAAEKGAPLWWVRGAKAFHQYHKHHMPPVHHLDSVLANAAIFASKWGESTMQHWVKAFRLMGLVGPDGAGGYKKLRDPGEEHLALTRQQEHQPYASSAWVLEQLEEAADSGSPRFALPAMTAA